MQSQRFGIYDIQARRDTDPVIANHQFKFSQSDRTNRYGDPAYPVIGKRMLSRNWKPVR
jgi:hypothetical protein